MIGTGESLAWEEMLVVEMSIFNFLTWKSIFHLSEHQKFEFFDNHGGMNRFEKKKFKEKSKPNGVYRNIRQCFL